MFMIGIWMRMCSIVALQRWALVVNQKTDWSKNLFRDIIAHTPRSDPIFAVISIRIKSHHINYSSLICVFDLSYFMSSWLCFLSLHPSWRPQRGGKMHKKKKKKGKGKNPDLTTPS